MAEHPIQGLMKTALENLKGMVEINTVVGDPVESPDGSMVIPVSRIALGFAAGGGEYQLAEDEPRTVAGEYPFAGGSGAGVSVQPMGFLVVGRNSVRMLPVDGGAPIDRLIDMAPELIDKLRGRGRVIETGPDTGVPRGDLQ